MTIRTLLADRNGGAASEFVLALPMVLILIFGAMEAGNYFWNQQKLVQSVRTGARYAARLPFSELCGNDGTGTPSSAIVTNIQNMTRSGSLSTTARSELPGLQNSDISVDVSCGDFVADGIYEHLGYDGVVVTVAATGVKYRSLLNGLGVLDDESRLAAEEHAPVIGL